MEMIKAQPDDGQVARIIADQRPHGDREEAVTRPVSTALWPIRIECTATLPETRIAGRAQRRGKRL